MASRPNSRPAQDPWPVISRCADSELVVKRSRFVAQAVRVADLDAASAAIAGARKEHWQARHHCTAVIVGPNGQVQRSNDDGEPAGTAGVPMLEVLRSRQITDVVVIVSRYFGGVLLGAGGLVRAYSGATGQVLDAAGTARRGYRQIWRLRAPMQRAGRFEYDMRGWLERHRGAIQSIEYGHELTIEVSLDLREGDALAGYLAAQNLPGTAEAVRTALVEFPAGSP